MTENHLPETIKYLFNRYWDEDLSDEEQDALEQCAENTVATYGWSAVFEAAFHYLTSACTKPEDVINFAHLYWIYDWYQWPIKDPYSFLGYFYYRIQFQTSKYDDMDILDSLATTILPKAGFPNADLMLNTRYMPETDPKMIEAAKAYEKD